MSNKNFDFIVLIIGAPHSGKSTIAHMIDEVLSRNNVKVVNQDLDSADREDYQEVKGKIAYISSYRTED